jgi:hypothetical protein
MLLESYAILNAEKHKSCETGTVSNGRVKTFRSRTVSSKWGEEDNRMMLLSDDVTGEVGVQGRKGKHI